MRNLIIAIFLITLVLVTSAFAETKTYWVSDSGSDNNGGTSLLDAFATLEKAFSVANDSLWFFLGYDTLEVVVAGTNAVFNPESTLEWKNRDDLFLHLHADTKSGVHDVIIVSGATTYDNWDLRVKGSNTLYAHLWEESFTPDSTQIPPWYADWMRELTRRSQFLRREMVVSGQVPYKLIEEDVSTHTWEDDEFALEKDSVWVKTLSQSKAAIPVVGTLLRVQDCKGVRIDNIYFVNGNPYFDQGLVEIARVDVVDIDSCSFLRSNSIGLLVNDCPRELPQDIGCCDKFGVRVSDSKADENGMIGMYFSNVYKLTVARGQSNDNNWAGYHRGDIFHKAGGIVLAGVSDVKIVNHNAEDNLARGLWIYGGENVIVSDDTLADNSYDGLTLTACPGPVLISRCLSRNNQAPISSEGFGKHTAAGIRNERRGPRI